MSMKTVSKEEFDAFVAGYPRKLERDVLTSCDPPLVSYNDFQRAPYWPDSVVASFSASSIPTGFRVLEDIRSPIADDGKRDTDTPLLDSNGANVEEGDEVDVVWGYGPPNTTILGRTYGSDGKRVVREKIIVRDRGTKYERWSFESCYNDARTFVDGMVKV